MTALNHLGVLAITGDDRKTFLQGQLTCDLNQLEVGQHVLCAQCDPKGKVLGLSYLVNRGDSYLQIMRRDQVATVQKNLGKYAVFSKVELSDASELWPVYGTKEAHPDALALSGGRYLLLAPDTAPANSLTPAEWELASIQAGEPSLPAELVGEYVPQMLNVDCLDGISFTKGCYIGQETIARMHYRGGLKRRAFYLAGQAEGPVTSGMDLEVKLGEHWRRAGRVLRFEQDGTQLHVLAVLPADTENTAQFRISGDEQSQLTMQALPYSLTVAEA